MSVLRQKHALVDNFNRCHDVRLVGILLRPLRNYDTTTFNVRRILMPVDIAVTAAVVETVLRAGDAVEIEPHL